MLKKVLIGVVIVAVIGAGAYILFGNKDNGDSTANNSSTGSSQNQISTTKDSTENGNIYSLTTSGSARKCTFTYSGANGSGTGTMYSDGKGRGLMNMEVVTTEGNKASTNTLVTADKVYGWTDTGGHSMGFIYDRSSLETNLDSAQSSSNSGSSSSTADPNKDYKLKCVSWTVDEATLAVPSDVMFTTIPKQ